VGGSGDYAFVAVSMAVLVVPVLLGIRRRREAVRHKLRRVLIVEAAYLLVVYALIQARQSPLTATLAGLLCAALVNQLLPARTRYVKRAQRRRAIARFELRTGKKYNPRKHHIHHKVPFSRGGSNTADNLEVLDGSENLSRGAKPPWWDLIGRMGR
jgi:hypothetical protein